MRKVTDSQTTLREGSSHEKNALVGEHGSVGFHDSEGGQVLRSDQL